MVIEGQKIVLRDWEEYDFEHYQKWMDHSHRWHQYNGPYFPKPSKECTDKFIADIRKKIAENNLNDPRKNLVISTNKNNQLIGMVNSYWECETTKWLSMGIAIYDDSLWGQGLGTEAMKLWTNYLFSVHKDIVRLDFRTWSGNSGMITVAKKLGFQMEACFRKARIVNGEYFDSLAFGILREEWR